jgi:predicted DNA binding CopG/RHH family protein
MKRFSLTLFSFSLIFLGFQSLGQSKIQNESNEFVRLSMNLITAVKNKADYQKYVNEYKALPIAQLAKFRYRQ